MICGGQYIASGSDSWSFWISNPISHVISTTVTPLLMNRSSLTKDPVEPRSLPEIHWFYTRTGGASNNGRTVLLKWWKRRCPLLYFSFAVWLIWAWLSSSENGSRGSELQNKEQHSSYDLAAKMMVLCNNTLRRRLGSISSMWWNGHPSMTGRQRTKSKSTEPSSEAVVLANEFKGFDTDTLELLLHQDARHYTRLKGISA